MSAQASSTHPFYSLIRNPVRFRLFLLRKLPAAFFAGLRAENVEESTATVSVPYKWFTQNPFRSTYFACLGMAAEMATGLLAMAHIYQRSPKVSMLVVSVEGRFYKKATGRTRFVCNDGQEIKEAAAAAVQSGAPQLVKAQASGFNTQDEMVAEFWITWSFRAKTS